MVALVQIFISVNPIFVVYFYVSFSAMSCSAEIPNPVAGRVCKIIVLLIQILVLLPPAAKINFKSKKVLTDHRRQALQPLRGCKNSGY